MKKKKQTEEEQALDIFNEVIAKANEEEDKLDPNSIEVVVDRVTHGLIGSLRIENSINKPLIKDNDIVNFRKPSRLLKKDMVLYVSHDEYFIRRIIKFKEDDIYVAGDGEREYHIIHKEDVVGKAISFERGKRSFSLVLNQNRKFYIFKKVNLAHFRLGNRISDYEADVNDLAFENALQTIENEQPKQEQYKYDFDLDSVLEGFVNPDDIAKQLMNPEPIAEEEYEYVDEFGNPINPEDIDEDDIVEDVEEENEEISDEIDEDVNISQDEEQENLSDEEAPSDDDNE